MARGVAMIAAFCMLGVTSGLIADFSDKAWEKPITKVVNLLMDMQKELEREAEEDADMYENLDCWCKSNDREKTQAIADANHRIKELTAAIETYTAKSSMLDTEIEKLNHQLGKQTSGLEQATALRTKESQEFQQNEKDLISNTAGLSGAVEALSKAQGDGPGFFRESLVQAQNVIKRNVNKHATTLSKKQISMLEEAQPQSGAIFGILKQMKEEFEANLAKTQKDEAAAANTFDELQSAKKKEIAAATKLAESKSVELADSQEKLAQSKTDLEDTEAQLAADTTFLANLKEKCANASLEYQQRKQVRTEETQAVSDTITILTEDESKDAYIKSGTFIQVSMHKRDQNNNQHKQQQAARILQKTGAKTGNAQVLKLAALARGPKDAMKTVANEIDKMVAELKRVQKEEVEKKDYCDSELHKNTMETNDKTDQKSDLETSIADLSSTIEKLGDEIAALKASVTEMQVETKKASENREKQNQDFQMTITDQKATQTILKKAMDRLKAFYAKKALLQTASHQTQPAQKTYQKSAGASGVMALIEQIIKESKDVEKKATDAENDAQAAYETFVADTSASIAAATENVVSNTESIAKAEKDKIAAQNDLSSTVDELIVLGETSVGLHQDCDFLLKNFNTRQQSRADEVEGLNAAKAVLSGANFGFLQH